MSFLPENYEIPATQNSYMKLEKGENTFRVLSPAIVGWEAWKTFPNGDKKPYRWPAGEGNGPADPSVFDLDDNGNPKFKHFWAFLVWNVTLRREPRPGDGRAGSGCLSGVG
ncbi:MAG TPA: hypothetical protein VHL31_13450 [Geminicoccus sp.]|jgi:hypothetical protein|uniref:hypothetical protein n=1 Tax=Geminicoccus sp. TaxID=2024832 RepID=UPI002E32735D|nr:hypothetical protein [Geminicoccus sp.]HEX2527288.1 hypothetical protein [Geminicoccus sp.]